MLINDEGKRFFEDIASYCMKNGALIPLSFVMGFYVTIVMKRWWEQYSTIPWPDGIAILVSTSIHGSDDRARVMRRTILRYVCLCQVMVFTMISPRVKRRFPTYNQIIEAGFLLENEKKIIDTMDQAFPNYPKHWMPIVWAGSIVMRARRESKIRDDYAVKTIMDELNKFRGRCGFLLYYDWVTVPLVYTQVVTLATYSFFLFSALGQQWTENSTQQGLSVLRWFPFLTILQFFFYMGWLKVAESLINPFGEDDDDFELNWIIDRNLTVAYCIVDEMHQEHPELVKDQYWEQVFPNEIPYNITSKRTGPPASSTSYMKVPQKNVLRKSSTSGSYLDFLEMNDRPFQDQDRPFTSRPSQSIDFYELVEQRRRERKERTRHRFLDMKVHLRHDNSGTFYTITIPRPASEEVSSENQEAAESQQDPSSENDSLSKAEKKD
ncbi:bestrophin-4 [Drosophila suzukii]|uniref:Bestrophin homolog n=1 Tax=Drosophila suzukii TaxID=28584 RepID=A0ABM4TR70_DROSZ